MPPFGFADTAMTSAAIPHEQEATSAESHSGTKRYRLAGTEVRLQPVEYIVEAATLAEAIEKAMEGSTVGRILVDRPAEIVDRQFDASGLCRPMLATPSLATAN